MTRLRFHARTAEKVVAWSANAAAPDPLARHLARAARRRLKVGKTK